MQEGPPGENPENKRKKENVCSCRGRERKEGRQLFFPSLLSDFVCVDIAQFFVCAKREREKEREERDF